MTLEEFGSACDAYCKQKHDQSKCLNCGHLIYATKIVQHETVCSLSTLFREAFSGEKYTSGLAKMHLLRMPLAYMRVGESMSGTSRFLVTKAVPGANYQNIKDIFCKSISDVNLSSSTITEQEIKGLLKLAESDREQECIRVAFHKALGLSQSGSRKHFGFEEMTKRSAQVDDCVKESLEIRQACDDLVEIQLQALSASATNSNSDEDQDVDEVPDSSTRVVISDIEQLALVAILKKSKCNWFDFHERVKDYSVVTADEPLEFDAHLKVFYGNLSSFLSPTEMKQVDLSRKPFEVDNNFYGNSK